MVDGPAEIGDPAATESSRACIRAFVKTVLIGDQLDRLQDFVSDSRYIEHNPRLTDGIASLHTALSEQHGDNRRIDYRHLHRILAEGNFVLSVCEGFSAGVHSAFYDLFRLENGKVAEHWDTTEKIAPRDEWKNDNGKF